MKPEITKLKKITAAVLAAAMAAVSLPAATAQDCLSVFSPMKISRTVSGGNTEEKSPGEDFYPSSSKKPNAFDNKFEDCACSLSDEMRKKYEDDNTLESRIKFMQSLAEPQIKPLISADTETDLQNIKSLSDIKNKDSFLYQNCPTIGDVKALVFLVDFADMRNEDSSLTAEEMEKRLEGTSDVFSDSDYPYKSVSGYYNASSYGKLNIDFDVYGWYSSENNRSFYENAEDHNDTAGNNVLIKEVMEHYDGVIDFSEYDANNDGLIDLVYFMYGGSNSGWGTQWWSYVTQFSSESTYDGEGLAKYCFLNIDGGAWSTNITVIHETGHLLGLPDYYNYGYQTDTNDTVDYIGMLDMMSSNRGDHNIFSKMLLGWVEPVFVSEDMSFDVLCSAETGAKAYIVAPEFKNGVLGEYYVLEYYKSSGAINSCYGVYCPQGAVRIYHADASFNGYDYTYSNDSDTAHPLLMLMNSNGYYYNALYGDETYADNYYTEGMTLGVNTAPSSELYDGVFSGINIHVDEISGDIAKITVDFSDSDSEAPKLKESRIPNVLGEALGVGGTQIFFSSNIYEGENIDKVSIAPKNDPLDKTYLEAAIKKYSSSEKNCTSSMGLYTSLMLNPDTEYILNIPGGTVTDSSGNPNEEINLTLDSAGGDGSYSDFGLTELLTLPQGSPENSEILTTKNKCLLLKNGNFVLMQDIGIKTGEENGVVSYSGGGLAYKVFSSDKKLICNKYITGVDTSYFESYELFELENGNVLQMLNCEFLVLDGDGNVVNKDTYLPENTESNGSVSYYFRRGDRFDVVAQTHDGIIYVCRIGNDGKVVKRFNLSEIYGDVMNGYAAEDFAKNYCNEDYTEYDIGKDGYLFHNYINTIEEAKKEPGSESVASGYTYYDGNGIRYAVNFIHPGFIAKFVALHDVQSAISKISLESTLISNLSLSDYLGNTLCGAECIVLEDNSLLVTFSICMFPKPGGFMPTQNNLVLRLNSDLELLWSCVVPFNVIDAFKYGDDILVLSNEKFYLFDDSAKTPIMTPETYNVSEEYDYDGEQGVIYSPQGKTAAQLRSAIECDDAVITVFDEEGKISEEGRILTQALIEVSPKDSPYSVYFGFVSDYYCTDDGWIARYNGKDSHAAIPSEIAGKKVKVITHQAFFNNKSLVSVEIPDEVILSKYAFDGCSFLTAAKIPPNVSFEWDGETYAEVFRSCSPDFTIYGYTNSQAEAYAEEYNIKFVPLDDDSKIQTDKGTVVTVPTNSCADLGGKELKVSVAEITEGSVTYDITLKDLDNNEAQPGGTVEVRIPLPADLDGESSYIYYKDKNGFLINMNAKYEDGCMIFTTDHFSKYVLSGRELAAIKLGELNNDGNITAVDAKWVLQAVSGSRTLTPEQGAAADVNGDGKITAVDAKWILQAVSGSRVLK